MRMGHRCPEVVWLNGLHPKKKKKAVFLLCFSYFDNSKVILKIMPVFSPLDLSQG